MKPNIFSYAKGKLTNDIVICWMLDWANSKNKIYKSLSQDLIRSFTEKYDLNVEFINIKKQYKNIDIVIEVNNSDVIAIEVNDPDVIIIGDEVDTLNNSNKLEKSKTIFEELEEYKNYNKHFVYYQVGSESLYNGVEEAGYKRVTRENILNIICKYRDLRNDLLNDYIDYLENKELVFNKYKSEENINKWDWETWKGYFNNLQIEKDIKEHCWNCISNKSGRFLVFNWGWKELKYVKDNQEIYYKLYLQIEVDHNNDNEKVRIVFKLNCEDINYRNDIKWHVYNYLKDIKNDEKCIKSKLELDNMINSAENTLERLVSNLQIMEPIL